MSEELRGRACELQPLVAAILLGTFAVDMGFLLGHTQLDGDKELSDHPCGDSCCQISGLLTLSCLASHLERPCLQASSGRGGLQTTARCGGASAGPFCSVGLLPDPSAVGKNQLQQQGWQGPDWSCSQPGS